MTPASHVVWDWNGTLLDDFDLTARIAEQTLAQLGSPGITGTHVREHFTRPFSTFYSRLLGRSVTDEELDFIRQRYEIEYSAEVLDVSLSPDAAAALDMVEAQATQSLLSMAPDVHLQALIDHHGIRTRFLRVEGSPTDSSDGNKAGRLRDHLASLGVDAQGTVLIGDTVDDGEAAAACDAGAVLVTTGSQARPPLEATGFPVVDTLLEAATIAVGDR